MLSSYLFVSKTMFGSQQYVLLVTLLRVVGLFVRLCLLTAVARLHKCSKSFGPEKVRILGLAYSAVHIFCLSCCDLAVC